MAKMSFTIDLNEKNDIEQVIDTLQLLAEQRTGGTDEARELQQQQESAYDLMQNAQAEQQSVAPPAPSQEQQQPVAPPAPPAPPAPSQEQQQPVAPPAPSQDVDSSGLPWDERIHGKQKNKNKDGTWRKKKGVDKELVAQVEAELRGEAAPPAPSQEQQQPVPPAPSQEQQQPVPPAPSQEQQQPVAPPAPPAPSQGQDDWPESTAFPASELPTTFPDFMVMLTERGITAEQIGPILDQFGIPSIGALASRSDLIPSIAAEVFK